MIYYTLYMIQDIDMLEQALLNGIKTYIVVQILGY